MTDASIGHTALAQMQGGSDESLFAGLLLLTKCSREMVQTLAPEACELLLGVSGKRTGGFLRRLLSTGDVDSPLSHMQVGRWSATHVQFLACARSRKRLLLFPSSNTASSTAFRIPSSRRPALDVAKPRAALCTTCSCWGSM